MKTIRLPADVEHLYLDEVAHLIADNRYPEGPKDADGMGYQLALIHAEEEAHQAAKNGVLRVRHPATHGPFSIELALKRAVVLVPDFALYVADRGLSVIVEASEQASQPQPAPAQDTATPAPVVQAIETKEQRQDRRLDACEMKGLVMPKSYLSRLPDGVGAVSDCEKVTRQAFSADIKAALKRRESVIREGIKVHRS